MFVNFPVCGFCLVLDGVDKLFVEGRGFLFRCHCWFVVEGNDGVWL